MPKKINNRLLNYRDIGERLRKIRELKKFTQSDIAKIIGVSRTTVVAIEKGQRKIKAKEIALVTKALDVSVNDILAPVDKSTSSSFQFRANRFRTKDDNEEIKLVIENWEELCDNYVYLEKVTNSPLTRNYQSEYKSSGIPINMCAENIAIEERKRLGLGDGPINDLREILEQEVGLKIFFIDMPYKFSEIYAFDEKFGGCLAINNKHPEERQRWSLSHGYLHFLAHRDSLIYHYENQYNRYPESERLAEAFPKYFLMPTNSILKHFTAKNEKGGFAVADLVTIANYFGVGVQTLTFRLEEMKLIPTGTWDKLKARKFKVKEAQSKLGMKINNKENRNKYPSYYINLAIKALNIGTISEGEFMKLLDVSRLEARDIAIMFKEQNKHDEININDIDLSIK